MKKVAFPPTSNDPAGASEGTKDSTTQPVSGPARRSKGSGFEYLDEDGAARYLKIKKRRLKDLRLRGGSPRWVRVGMSVRYRTDWLDAWAEQNAVSSTSEEIARRRG
jgi:hypothetical protein